MEPFDIRAVSSTDLIRRRINLCLRLVEIEFSTQTPQEINESGVNSRGCIKLIQEIDSVLRNRIFPGNDPSL